MARPYFTPRREECSLCNAIMMVSFAFRREISPGSKFKIRWFKIVLSDGLEFESRCTLQFM